MFSIVSVFPLEETVINITFPHHSSIRKQQFRRKWEAYKELGKTRDEWLAENLPAVPPENETPAKTEKKTQYSTINVPRRRCRESKAHKRWKSATRKDFSESSRSLWSTVGIQRKKCNAPGREMCRQQFSTLPKGSADG